MPRPVRLVVRLERAVQRVARPWRDAITNRRHAQADQRILCLRHPTLSTRYYDSLLGWLEERFPEVRGAFEVATLPVKKRNWDSTALVAPWILDAHLAPGRQEHEWLRSVEAECRRHGVPVVNPLRGAVHAGKVSAAAIMASVGLRTPWMAPIRDLTEWRRGLAWLPGPILIRENRPHAGQNISYLVTSPRELSAVPIEKFAEPIAVEYIDVQNPRDGLYRRYRYIAAGDAGLTLNLHAAPQWDVRGATRVTNEQIVREELAFLGAADPNHAIFQRARRALKLDFVGFDYSYDAQGRLVVWDANPMPRLTGANLAEGPQVAARFEQAWGLLFRMLLEKAGMAVPGSLAEFAASNPAVQCAVRRAAA